jgi:hypothetical protein
VTVIYKSTLELVEEVSGGAGRCTAYVPVGATLLKVGTQANDIVIWYSCDPSAPKEVRQFYVVPTGAEIPTDRFEVGAYFDTVQMRTGAGELVWHIFEPARDRSVVPH